MALCSCYCVNCEAGDHNHCEHSCNGRNIEEDDWDDYEDNDD